MSKNKTPTPPPSDSVTKLKDDLDPTKTKIPPTITTPPAPPDGTAKGRGRPPGAKGKPKAAMSPEALLLLGKIKGEKGKMAVSFFQVPLNLGKNYYLTKHPEAKDKIIEIWKLNDVEKSQLEVHGGMLLEYLILKLSTRIELVMLALGGFTCGSIIAGKFMNSQQLFDKPKNVKDPVKKDPVKTQP